MEHALTYTAFEGMNLLCHGPLEDVALEIRRHFKLDPKAQILVFSDSSGKQMDFDLTGTEKEVLEKLKVYLPETKEPPATGPGRPKLGVIAREISLLPRHWEWLSTQPGGASSTLRRLVDDARKRDEGKESIKQIQERTYKFMSVLAGNLPNYEEALRLLYRRDGKTFAKAIAEWPVDVRFHVQKLSQQIFETN